MWKKATFGAALLGVVVYFGLDSFRPKVKTPKDLNPQYDYIIIGGGTAGCVVAARLSENPDVSVLVLEAGGEENELFYSHIPGSVAFLQKTSMDWQYFTVPQKKYGNGLNDNQAAWPRGKGLGGTAILNLMNYVRGNALDFDHWAELGNSGWSYKDVLPYFKKSEMIMIERLKSSQYHGTTGPVVVTENEATKLDEVFMDAVRYLGYPITDDYNGAQQEGFSSIQFTISNGKRVSTASAYLRPAMGRPNLHIVTRAHVSRIIFEYNDQEKKAAGVEYLYNGQKHKVLVNREVILSAGAVSSPHILMLSGIGHKDKLEKFSIQAVHHLPAVGQHLKDHLGLHCRYSVNETIGFDFEKYSSVPGFLQMGFEYYFKSSAA